MAVVHSMMEPHADSILSQMPKQVAWSLNILRRQRR